MLEVLAVNAPPVYAKRKTSRSDGRSVGGWVKVGG